MGIAIPQLAPASLDRTSGAQVIDGSLKIVGDNDAHLTRTLTENGTKISSTFSLWIKKGDQGVGNNPVGYESFVDAYYSDDTYTRLYLNANKLSMVTRVSDSQNYLNTNALLRDTGWYHIVGTSSTAGHPAVYVNGTQITDYSASDFSNTLTQNAATKSGAKIEIATQNNRTDRNFDGQISNFYFIDGQELGPEYFGFTDPLTNTWKPKDFRNESVAKEQTFTSSTITNVVTNGTAGITTLTFSDNTNFSNFSVGDVVQTTSTTYVSNSAVTDPEYAFDDSSSTEATFNGVNSWISFTVTELTVPFIIRNDSSGTAQTVAMFTDSSGSSAAGGSWGSTGTNNLSPAVTTTVKDTYTFPSTGTYYLRHTVGSDSNIFVYEIGGAVNIQSIDSGNNKIETDVGTFTGSDGTGVSGKDTTISITDFGFGTNGFYLPLDGNSPIGQDKSGNGNDLTPVNFGGSVALDSPLVTGARPILNTTQGGTQAGVGVFGSKQNVGYAVTVYNDGGGNKYYIDGVKQDTVTGLIRGATYTFDTSDSTVSSHPFRFSATSNGSHGGGSEYTNGVAAITGAATTITVPHDAPNTLYYYCTSHSGMGADITGITTNEKLADQYASHVTLALPFVGGTNDVSASIACTSTPKTVSNSGSTDSPNRHYYSSSRNFDGSNDKLDVSDGTNFDVTTGDWCAECWFYTPSSDSTSQRIFANNAADSAQFNLGINSLELFVYLGSNLIISPQSATTIPAAKWVHLALTHVDSSNKTRLFVDGREIASSTTALSGSEDGFYLSHNTTHSTRYITANYCDVRFYKGVAKYTSDFVVPSPSPDILPDTPSGVSGGSKLTKITDGAVYFDGTNDNLTIAAHSDLDLSSGDFTVEGFVYPLRSQEQGFVNNWNTLSTGQFQVQMSSSGTLQASWAPYSTAVYAVTGTTPIRLNAWSHFAYTRSGSTFELFLDGISQGTQTSSNNASANSDFILGENSDGARDLQGYLSNVRVIKGTALYTSRFTPPTAPLTNITNTKLLICKSVGIVTATVAPTGIGVTVNGDAAATNFNPFNTDINTVRGQETGYCTWNPLAVQPSGHGGFRDGNLEIIASTDGSGKSSLATFPIPSTGKWYWEVKAYRTGTTSNGGGAVGVAEASAVQATAVGGGSGNRLGELNSSSWVFSLNLFDARHRNTADYSNYLNGGTAVADTGIIGIAVDMDNDKMWAHYNGVYGNAGGIGNPVTGANPAFSGEFSGLELFPAGGIAVDSGSGYIRANWGQKPFSFTPPDGFQPLNAANTRPVNVILRPNQYVGIATWTGDGTNGSGTSNDRQVTGLSLKPDLVWCKIRTQGYTHVLWDSVRGAGSNKQIQPDTTQPEGGTANTAAYGYISEFTSDGFKTITGSSDNDYFDRLNDGYVAWCWKAGGSKNTFNIDDVGYASAAAAGLNGGGITPTGASVGTKQGFSIIKYTGTGSAATISHGLSSAPACILVKTLDDAYNWFVYHKGTDPNSPEDYYLKLNTNAARIDSSNAWNDTAPTSTLFTVGTDGSVNELDDDYIAYLWQDVPGLQKFGAYEGSGVAGNYVHLGFRPALLWIKSVDTTSIDNWGIIDSTRSYANVGNHTLATNLANAESYYGDGSSVFGANNKIDLLSDGFRLQETSGFGNTSGITFLYCAWAEAPSIDLYGGGANAR